MFILEKNNRAKGAPQSWVLGKMPLWEALHKTCFSLVLEDEGLRVTEQRGNLVQSKGELLTLLLLRQRGLKHSCLMW